MPRHLSKEEVGQWRQLDVTREVLARVGKELEESVMSIVTGSILSETADRTAMNTADAVGYMRGLNWLIEFEGDEEEDKPQPDRGSFTWTDSQENP